MGGGCDAHSEDFIDQVIPVVLLFLMVGVLIKQIRKKLPTWFQLPYTVLMFLFGLLVTALSREAASWGRVGRSVDVWLGVHPHVILLIFLPPLLFESAFDMDYNVFQRVAGQALLLAVPGVFLALGLTACYIKLFFSGKYGWGWDMSLLLGSILSATDPVAVVAVLKTLGAPKKLASLIEGESLLNDGSAFVLFLIFKDIAAGCDSNAGDAILTFAQLSLGGPLFGLACAWVAYLFLYFVYNDPKVEITGVVVVVFGIFFVSELTLGVSSVLAVVVFGLFFAKEGKYALSREVHHIGHAIWAQIGHISNTVIFGMSGLVFYKEVFQNADIAGDWENWALLVLSFVMLHVVRFVCILAFYPLLRRMGYGLTWKECSIMWFGGLRGAVGLALGLIVDHDPGIERTDRTILNFHVAGIVFFTLILNGTFAGAFYNWVKPYPDTSPFKVRLMEKALEVLQLEQAEALHELKTKWYFKTANWPLVLDLLPNFSDVQFKHSHVHLNLQTVNQCFRKARFKNLWEGGFKHARKAIRSDGSGSHFSPKPAHMTSGMVDTVLTALQKRASFDPASDDAPGVPKIREVDMDELGSPIMRIVSVHDEGGEEKGGTPNSNNEQAGASKTSNRSLHASSTSTMRRRESMAPGLAVLMETAQPLRTTKSLGPSAMKSLKHMDVHKREEVCQIIFTTVKAYYHAMYEDRYLDSSAMLMLLDSLDKGTEAARHFNEDPGTPITISYKRLVHDINQVSTVTGWARKLPTRFGVTRAIRTMFEYSQAKRNQEALHAFIEAHERIMSADDYRSDLDPKVTDDITDCVEAAHKLLLKLRQEAPIASKVLTAVMATKVILNEQRGKILHLYHEEGMLDEGVKGELIDLVEARLFELHSFFPSPFVLGIKNDSSKRVNPVRNNNVTFGKGGHVKPDVTTTSGGAGAGAGAGAGTGTAHPLNGSREAFT